MSKHDTNLIKAASDVRALDAQSEQAPRIGVFACSDSAAGQLADCMRCMGKAPAMVQSYASLGSQSPVMDALDCAVVSIHDPKYPGQLSPATEEFIDLLFGALANTPGFSVVIITPRALASIVSYMFENQPVTLLIDSAKGNICSGLFHMVRCCGTGLASGEARPAKDHLAAIDGTSRIDGGLAGENDFAPGEGKVVSMAERAPSKRVLARTSGCQSCASEASAAMNRALTNPAAAASGPLELVESAGAASSDLVSQLCAVTARIDAMLERLPASGVTNGHGSSGQGTNEQGANQQASSEQADGDERAQGQNSDAQNHANPSVSTSEETQQSPLSTDPPKATPVSPAGGGNLAGADKPDRSDLEPIDDASLLRCLISRRRHRNDAFAQAMFSDPAWEMMLDLALARAERKRVSVSSLCIASGVPQTTALRLIAKLVDEGLFVRVEDQGDKRRVFVALTEKSLEGLNRYLRNMRSHNCS